MTKPHKYLAIAYLLLWVWIILFCPPTYAQLRISQPPTATAKVIRVLDGDTFEVIQNLQKVRWRISGIDAPELKQPFGQQSTDSLTKILINRTITVQLLGKDLFQRDIINVTHIQGKRCDLDSLIIANGWAWSQKGWYANVYYLHRDPIQSIAVTQKRGIWQCDTPVIPKMWRRLNAHNKRLANNCN